MSHHHAPSGGPASWLRPLARLTGWALAAGALGLSALPAQAQTTPFPVPPIQPHVLLSQGLPPTTPTITQLYDITQAAGALDFSTTIGSTSSIQYNSIGYHPSDGYIYGIQVDDNTTAAGRANTNHLVRIDSDGVVVDLGAVTGLPTSTAPSGTDPSGYAAGTFGDGAYANTLFVRRGTTDGSTALYAVDITNVLSNPATTATAKLITMSATLPNTADLVWNQGYLWTVYSTNGPAAVTIYRISVVDGTVTPFSLPAVGPKGDLSTAAIRAQIYGAQWTYSDNGSDNGIIGISGNGTVFGGVSGSATPAAYKIQIINGASAAPTFVILSALTTDGTTQNDATSIIGSPVDLELTKTASVPTSARVVTYTFTVTNKSGAGIVSSGSTLQDTFPAQITNIAVQGSADCSTTTVTGGTLLTCNVNSLVSEASEVITVTATLAAGETFTNTATITGDQTDPNPDNNTASVTSSMAQPVLSITKTDGSTAALTTGGTVQYTVTVTNTGAVDAAGAQVTDPAPAGILVAGSSWTCSPAAFCGSAGPILSTGANLLDDTLASLPAGSSVVYTITAQVVSTGLPAVVTNVARATPPAGGLCADNSAPPCTASVNNPAVPTVSITKTADAETTPGGQVIYKVTVDNTGSLDDSGTVVQDTMPTDIASATWTCTAAGGAVCPGLSGNAPLNQTLTTFPAGSNVVYTITAKVSASVAVGTILKNTATVTPPTTGLCGQSGCSAEADTNVVTPPQNTSGNSGGAAVPALDARALALLALLLCGLAGFSLRRRP